MSLTFDTGTRKAQLYVLESSGWRPASNKPQNGAEIIVAQEELERDGTTGEFFTAIGHYFADTNTVQLGVFDVVIDNEFPWDQIQWWKPLYRPDEADWLDRVLSDGGFNDPYLRAAIGGGGAVRYGFVDRRRN